MTINEQQQKEMLDAAKPLILWMNENCNPHCNAIVDQNTVELTEGIAHSRCDDFLKDLRNGKLPPMPFMTDK